MLVSRGWGRRRWICRFDPHLPIEEAMEALHDWVKSGKVRYIGASSMWTWQVAMMQFVAEKNGWTRFVSMQNHSNLLYGEEEREMNRICDAMGVGLIPWSPVARGLLARSPTDDGKPLRSEVELKNQAKLNMPQMPGRTDAGKEIFKKAQEIAEKKGWKMSHVALAWINATVSSPIIGLSSVGRIDEALAARGKELTEEETRYLEEPYIAQAIVGHS